MPRARPRGLAMPAADGRPRRCGGLLRATPWPCTARPWRPRARARHPSRYGEVSRAICWPCRARSGEVLRLPQLHPAGNAFVHPNLTRSRPRGDRGPSPRGPHHPATAASAGPFLLRFRNSDGQKLQRGERRSPPAPQRRPPTASRSAVTGRADEHRDLDGRGHPNPPKLPSFLEPKWRRLWSDVFLNFLKST